MIFLGLISLNIALLFVFGYTIFLDFIHTITNMSSKPYIWIGNHSILAITRLASNYSSEHGWEWISNISGTIQLFLLAVVGACILIILFQGYRNNRIGIDPYLLLACTIGALMIHNRTSHDYKLSILAGPMAILFLDLSTTVHAKTLAEVQSIVYNDDPDIIRFVFFHVIFLHQ